MPVGRCKFGADALYGAVIGAVSVSMFSICATGICAPGAHADSIFDGPDKRDTRDGDISSDRERLDYRDRKRDEDERRDLERRERYRDDADDGGRDDRDGGDRDGDGSASPRSSDDRSDDRKRRSDDKGAGGGRSDDYFDRGGSDDFSGESFIDTRFGKSTFRDLLDAGRRWKSRSSIHLNANIGKDDSKGDDEDARAVKTRDMSDDVDPADHDVDDMDAPRWQRLLKPIPNMLTDWVPDKPDRLHLGGFSIDPFNGSPVPYKLNGHIDIDRGYPWDDNGSFD